MQKSLAILLVISALLCSLVAAYPETSSGNGNHTCGPPPNGQRPAGAPPGGPPPGGPPPAGRGGPCGPPGQRPPTTAATTG